MSDAGGPVPRFSSPTHSAASREAALKDGEELELRLLGIVEQVVTPGKGVAHRLLAGREVARSSGQKW